MSAVSGSMAKRCSRRWLTSGCSGDGGRSQGKAICSFVCSCLYDTTKLHFVNCQMPILYLCVEIHQLFLLSFVILFFYTTYQMPWNTAYGAFVAITSMWKINATWSTLECPSHHGHSSTKPGQHLCRLLSSIYVVMFFFQ